MFLQDEREAREKIKLEQEQAYAESLEADRAKSLVRRAQEDAERAQQKAALEELTRRDDELRQQNMQKQVRRQQHVYMMCSASSCGIH